MELHSVSTSKYSSKISWKNVLSLVDRRIRGSKDRSILLVHKLCVFVNLLSIVFMLAFLQLLSYECKLFHLNLIEKYSIAGRRSFSSLMIVEDIVEIVAAISTQSSPNSSISSLLTNYNYFLKVPSRAFEIQISRLDDKLRGYLDYEDSAVKVDYGNHLNHHVQANSFYPNIDNRYYLTLDKANVVFIEKCMDIRNLAQVVHTIGDQTAAEVLRSKTKLLIKAALDEYFPQLLNDFGSYSVTEGKLDKLDLLQYSVLINYFIWITNVAIVISLLKSVVLTIKLRRITVDLFAIYSNIKIWEIESMRLSSSNLAIFIYDNLLNEVNLIEAYKSSQFYKEISSFCSRQTKDKFGKNRRGKNLYLSPSYVYKGTKFVWLEQLLSLANFALIYITAILLLNDEAKSTNVINFSEVAFRNVYKPFSIGLTRQAVISGMYSNAEMSNYLLESLKRDAQSSIASLKPQLVDTRFKLASVLPPATVNSLFELLDADICKQLSTQQTQRIEERWQDNLLPDFCYSSNKGVLTKGLHEFIQFEQFYYDTLLTTSMKFGSMETYFSKEFLEIKFGRAIGSSAFSSSFFSIASKQVELIFNRIDIYSLWFTRAAITFLIMLTLPLSIWAIRILKVHISLTYKVFDIIDLYFFWKNSYLQNSVKQHFK